MAILNNTGGKTIVWVRLWRRNRASRTVGISADRVRDSCCNCACCQQLTRCSYDCSMQTAVKPANVTSSVHAVVRLQHANSCWNCQRYQQRTRCSSTAACKQLLKLQMLSAAYTLCYDCSMQIAVRTANVTSSAHAAVRQQNANSCYDCVYYQQLTRCTWLRLQQCTTAAHQQLLRLHMLITEYCRVWLRLQLAAVVNSLLQLFWLY